MNQIKNEIEKLSAEIKEKIQKNLDTQETDLDQMEFLVKLLKRIDSLEKTLKDNFENKLEISTDIEKSIKTISEKFFLPNFDKSKCINVITYIPKETKKKLDSFQEKFNVKNQNLLYIYIFEKFIQDIQEFENKEESP